MTQQYAIISVYDKKGIEDLAREFVSNSIRIISSGGTADFLEKNAIPVIPVEDVTHSPESFDGRIKTISFQIASGILYDRKKISHLDQAKKLSIPSIDFVVGNVYPFWEKSSIEMIDIGGPTLIRAAAKNYQSVTVITDPNDYIKVIKQLKKKGATTLLLRKELASKAFSYIAQYDILISNHFNRENNTSKFLSLSNGKQLRYGDNPHQKGFLFEEGKSDALGLSNFKVLQGKDPSYSNYLDVNAGLEALSLIGSKSPACIILKHNNPCGASVASTIEKAFKKSWYDGDTLAAFGGIVVINRPLTKKFAEIILEDKKFLEIIVAPEFSNDALLLLKPKTKLQLWENKALLHPSRLPYEDIKKVRNGYLVQEGHIHVLKKNNLHVVTKKKPSVKQIKDMVFAWSICQVSKSNCVVVARDNTLLSSGVGQQDRKRCCELSISKAHLSLENAVAASDGFFPFVDGPEILVNAGIKAIIQPGGSIHDKDVIDFCDKNGIVMIFTGIRSFKH